MESAVVLRTRRFLLAAASVAVAALLLWPVRHFFFRGQTDFVQLYVGAKLSGTGRMYDPEANYEWHRKLFGVRLPAVLHTRPPFYGLLLKPLASAPYPVAWWLFVGMNLAAAAWVFFRFLGPRPPSAAFGLVYPATWLAILWGQDVWLAVGLFAAAVLLLESGREFRAGALLSLCAIKAHLFVLVPLVLLVRGRWRLLAGGAAGGVALGALAFAGGGPRWVNEYLRVLANPVIHRDMAGMPNLQGMGALFGSPAWFVPATSAAVAVLVLWISRRASSVPEALAVALVGSFLVSYHAYAHDAVTLLLAFALAGPASLHGVRALAWYLLASPLPLVFVVLGPPFHAALPLAACVVLLLMAASEVQRVSGPGGQAPRTP